MKVKYIILFLLFGIYSSSIFSQKLSFPYNGNFDFRLPNTNIPLYWKHTGVETTSFTFGLTEKGIDYSLNLNNLQLGEFNLPLSLSNNLQLGQFNIPLNADLALTISGDSLIQLPSNFYQIKGGMYYLPIDNLLSQIKKAPDSFLTIEFQYKLISKDTNSYAQVGIYHDGVFIPFSENLIRTRNYWKKVKAVADISNTQSTSIAIVFNGKGMLQFDNMRLSLNGKKVIDKTPEQPKRTDIKWLKENAIIFNRETIEKNNALVFEKLLSEINESAKVVGLGESTHGTSEFIRYRTEIIKELVQKKDFNIILLETNLPETFEGINRYVLKGMGSAKQSLEYTLAFPWKTKEMEELIEWIKKFNETSEKKVIFSGMDCQFNYLIIDALKNDVKDTLFWNPVESELKSISAFVESYQSLLYQGEQKNIIDNYLYQIQKIRNHYLSKEKDLEKSIGKWETAKLKRYIEVMYQWMSLKKDFQRERFMYDNVIWHLENYPDSKIAIIAHDAHITKNPAQNGSGTFLSNQLGDQYFTISFTTAEGTYFGYDINKQMFSTGNILPPAPESIENLFLKSKIDNAYIILKNKKNLPQWFKRNLNALGIGFAITTDQTYLIQSSIGIQNYFDAIFFIRNTTASENYMQHK